MIRIGIFSGRVNAIELWDISEFKDLYQIVGCELLGLSAFAGHSVYVDEEGRLKPTPILTGLQTGGHVLVGTIVFVHIDENGKLVSLTDEEIAQFSEFKIEPLGEGYFYLEELEREVPAKKFHITVEFDFETEDPNYGEEDCMQDVREHLSTIGDVANARASNMKMEAKKC